jgi:phage-related minor tail protein
MKKDAEKMTTVIALYYSELHGQVLDKLMRRNKSASREQVCILTTIANVLPDRISSIVVQIFALYDAIHWYIALHYHRRFATTRIYQAHVSI